MAYQRKVVKRISKEARRRYGKGGYTRAERKKIKSAFQTGIVESGLRNVSYGDADSLGWRQERASLYPNPTNVKASVKRYFNEADQHYGGQSAAELSADVQRPAAQYRGRYADHRGEGKRLLRKHVLGKPAPKGGRTTTTRKPGKLKKIEGVDNSAEREALLLDYFRSDRDKPGALISLSSGLSQVQDTPDRLKFVKGKKVKVKTGGASGGGKVSGGGSYHGTEMMVKNAVKGLAVSNFKRTPERNAAVGGSPTSDHLTTNKSAFAADIPFGSGKRIARRLGIKGWKPGTYQRYTITGAGGKKYSVQLLESVAGHYDHTHLGVRAL